jgi:RNA polymerase sigma factor (sigma-70 family)
VTDQSLEELVQPASAGQRDALEELLRRIQQPVYALSLRMLWHPEDARDATQEILIRIMTHLSSFRGQSRFLTWAYRVASNYLMTCRQSRLEQQRYTFERFGHELHDGLELASEAEWPPDKAMLLEELKVGCMLGMLTCLDREHRLAYVLGEILELEGPEAAAVLEITPAAFRKRLSRARTALVQFTRANCGLVGAENPCHCTRRLPDSIRRGRVVAGRLLFADARRAATFPAVLQKVRALDEVQRTAVLYRTHSEPKPGAELLARISAILDQ